MLRVIVSTRASAAVRYFDHSLSKGDYYGAGQELVGQWGGRGAERLGLSGDVNREDFAALARNRNPSGGLLTQRDRQFRRVGYDLNFHVPKSVSLVYELTRDPAIFDAFRQSVRETMQHIEKEMKTRVRINGAEHDRVTGEMLWSEFYHFTTRPTGADRTPDPHLHSHCFAFNATWDPLEERWKAGQFGDLKRDASYFEASFHSRLTAKLSDLGYAVERKGKNWELRSVSRSVLDRFSRRTHEINLVARKLGIREPKEKDALGVLTRQSKDKLLSMDALRELWKRRLTVAELDSLLTLKWREPAQNRVSASAAVEHAIGVAFERRSFVSEKELLTHALRYGYGSCSHVDIERLTSQSDQLIRKVEDDRIIVSTREVLREERHMVDFARDGRGTRPRAYPCGQYVIHDERLNVQQRLAVEHVLTSPDRVTVVRGVAGAGKTTMMKEAMRGFGNAGYEVFAFAPTTEASRGVLRKEGFGQADTVAKLLLDESLQKRLRGQVVWVDEAGLLGSRSMAKLFHLAERLDFRIVLSGDKGQHKSVERGSPLHLLEELAGVAPAWVQEVIRQRGAYRSVVESLSQGKSAEGLNRLQQMGALKELPQDQAHQSIARDYVQAVAAGKTVLVVSPTHAEGELVTAAIRAELAQSGDLKESKNFMQLKSTSLTIAERADFHTYIPGDVIQFHQNVKRQGFGEDYDGFKAGERVTVTKVDESSGRVDVKGSTGIERPLPLRHSDRFEHFSTREIELSIGDRIKLTRNSKTIDGLHALNNGAVYRVAGFTDSGDITLNNGWVVAKQNGHIAHGYCSTSPSSQAKTVDVVLIAQSALSFPASSAEQFYVSVSRGREDARVYTDDIEGLRAAVLRTIDLRAAHQAIGYDIESECLFSAGDDWASRERAREQGYAREERDESREFGFAR